MKNFNWQDIPYKNLLDGNYPKVIEYYKNLLEKEPANISHYWYLGLAHLLEGQEEEAQLTWFIALNQQSPEDLDDQILELVDILEKEAVRQESNNNISEAWLIRGHIREIKPDTLNNLIKLILLDISLGEPTLSKFQDWSVIECFQSPSEEEIEDNTLIKCLKEVLKFPTFESVEFAKLCINISRDLDQIINVIGEAAEVMGYENQYLIFSADLLKVCLEKQPYNLKTIKNIFWFYSGAKYYDQALEVALDFQKKSNSLASQVFANHQLLHIYLIRSDWANVLPTASKQLKLLTEFSASNTEIELFLQDSLTIVPQPLLYIRDKPEENRVFFNQISKIFQNNVAPNQKIDQINTSHYKKQHIEKKILKIGYIGHTFRRHSVGWLARWLIKHHNSEKIEVYIYAVTKYSDEYTDDWFVKYAKKFYSYDRNVKEIICQIKQDEIDILVDLDSLTLNLTCQVMAHKPSLIQATWLGMDATGIPAIDYFIADPYVLPDEAQTYYSEKIWRLPHTYLGIDGFEIGIPTLTREDLNISNKAIVFMNFQNALKRHPDTIRLQLRIIKNVPNSYLLIKGSGDDSIVKTFFKELAIEEGLDFERLRFLDTYKTELEHRANLQLADVVLDTYPYNGATTTLEVLWSEIPLVTKVGQQFAARNSYTFMINAGITEGIAWTNEEYIEWGIKLGTDENLRKEISWKLRQSKKTSPLWNGKQFARDMENAYRQMWEIYVEQNQTK